MEKNNGYRIAGFILGLLSVLSGGLVLAILGLVFSIKCRKVLKENNQKDGLVTAGFVLSIIGIVKTVIVTIFVFFAIIFSIYAESNGIITKTKRTPYIYNNYDEKVYLDEFDNKFDELGEKYLDQLDNKLDKLDEKFDKIGNDLDEYFENYFDNVFGNFNL